MAFLRPLKEPESVLLTLAGFFAYGKSQSGVGGVKTKLSMAVVHIYTLYLRFRQSRIARDVATAGKLPRAYPQRCKPFRHGVPNALSDKLGRFNIPVLMITFTSVVIVMLWLSAIGNATLINFRRSL